MGKKILAAVSGGVDSSVAAFLLKESGYEVTGVTMCLGIRQTGGKVRCCGPQAVNDAKRVCHKLGISHYVMDFAGELQDKVVSRFISQYLEGKTPNPCVECNRFLKFGVLMRKALALGFDFLATGHYAKIEKDNGRPVLKRPKDKLKDQTYFLYPIKKERLGSIIFPLGELTKDEVRGLARQKDLSVADKPQSQDICFITGGDYREFIFERIGSPGPGDILDTRGSIRGTHKGIFNYTVGQRKGLGISDKSPLYVISKDAERNRLRVGPKESLAARGLMAGDSNLLVDNLPQEAYARIRYAQREVKCRILHRGREIEVLFSEKQEAIAPGQAVVFYDGDVVLGGGTIKEVIW